MSMCVCLCICVGGEVLWPPLLSEAAEVVLPSGAIADVGHSTTRAYVLPGSRGLADVGLIAIRGTISPHRRHLQC